MLAYLHIQTVCAYKERIVIFKALLSLVQGYHYATIFEIQTRH